MRWIVCLLALIIPLNSHASEPFVRVFNHYKIGKITVHSADSLNNNQKQKLLNIFIKSKRLFFNKFEDIKIETCNLNDFSIFIIYKDTLNDKRFFHDRDFLEVFGRYYWLHNHLYITTEVFTKNEYLAHELAHYFYDECNVFRGIEREENKAYDFQALYKRIYE